MQSDTKTKIDKTWNQTKRQVSERQILNSNEAQRRLESNERRLYDTSVNEATNKIRSLIQKNKHKSADDVFDHQLGTVWSMIDKHYKLSKIVQTQIGKKSADAVIAYCRVTKKQVMIKLYQDVGSDIETCRNLVRMISIQKHISGSKSVLPQLLDLIYEEGNLFIIQEHFKSSLQTILKQEFNNNFNEEHLINIMYNLLCSLKTMHACNIIVRDLQPETILINEKCQIKILLDQKARTLPNSCIGKGSGNTKRVRDSIYQQNLKSKIDEDSIENMISSKICKIKSKQQDKKRCLSPLIGSVQYRAPEISISQDQYDQSADMWSLGCVLYDLLDLLNQKDEQNASEKAGEEKRKIQQSFLIPGSDEHPIVPRSAGTDQSEQILKNLVDMTGQNSDNDLCFVQEGIFEKFKEINQSTSCKIQQEQKNFDKEFENRNPEIVKMLKQLIKINPFYRPTTLEMLRNHVFDQIRDKKSESISFKKLILELDQDDAYDYEKRESLQYGSQDFLEMIKKDALEMHQSYLNKVQNINID